MRKRKQPIYRGKLVKADYAHFVPEIERLVRQHAQISVLFDLTGCHGWEAAALWDKIKFDITHFADIERIAVIRDKPGIRSGSTKRRKRH